jgi:hypothetical protein
MMQMSAEEETEFQPFITSEGRLTISVGSTFTWNGQQHWPKVMLEDSPAAYLDEEGIAQVETSDQFFYRITESAHQIHAEMIARMKKDVTDRAAADAEARREAQKAFK